jgi:hypothetical protein
MKTFLGFNDLPLEDFIKKQPPDPIQQYIKTLMLEHLSKNYKVKLPIFTSSELLEFWPEHDALHFLTGLDNSQSSEKKIVWYERIYNVGFKERNGYITYLVEDNPAVKIDRENLLEIANVIRKYHLNNFQNYDSGEYRISLPGQFVKDLLGQS